MARNTAITLAAAALVSTAVGAAAAVQSGGIQEASEQKIALNKVPAATMKGAQAELTGISGAELVKLKDGSTVYEVRGKNKAGKTVELYVDSNGKVLGPESKEHDED